MLHIKTISREQPALAQGVSRIQVKVADILSVLDVLVVIQDLIQGVLLKGVVVETEKADPDA